MSEVPLYLPSLWQANPLHCHVTYVNTNHIHAKYVKVICEGFGRRGPFSRQVDVRLPGKGNSNSHGARPVHLNITMIKWIRTSRLSIKNSLYADAEDRSHYCERMLLSKEESHKEEVFFFFITLQPRVE